MNVILSTIVDTPANRADMPDAEFAAYVAPEELADVVAFRLAEACTSITGAITVTR